MDFHDIAVIVYILNQCAVLLRPDDGTDVSQAELRIIRQTFFQRIKRIHNPFFRNHISLLRVRHVWTVRFQLLPDTETVRLIRGFCALCLDLIVTRLI